MLNIQDESIDDFYSYTDNVHGMYMPKSIQNELTSRSKVGTDEYNKNLEKQLEKDGKNKLIQIEKVIVVLLLLWKIEVMILLKMLKKTG